MPPILWEFLQLKCRWDRTGSLVELTAIQTLDLFVT